MYFFLYVSKPLHVPSSNLVSFVVKLTLKPRKYWYFDFHYKKIIKIKTWELINIHGTF